MRIGDSPGGPGEHPGSALLRAAGLILARRAANGYREYGEADLRLVAEIRSLLSVGFTLEDARPFVACLRAGPNAETCPEPVAVYRRRLAEIDEEIRTLVNGGQKWPNN